MTQKLRKSLSSDYSFKIILVGDSGVGKSSMLLRFADNAFSENYLTTIGVDFRFRNIRIGEDLVRLQIWDTAGQERFRNMTSAFCRGVDGILIVYDVTNVRSFENIDGWLDTVTRYSTQGTCKILLGNKSDLKPKAVSSEQARRKAKQLGVAYLETSAKKALNIKEAFHSITEELIEGHKRCGGTEGLCEAKKSFKLEQNLKPAPEKPTDTTDEIGWNRIGPIGNSGRGVLARAGELGLFCVAPRMINGDVAVPVGQVIACPLQK